MAPIASIIMPSTRSSQNTNKDGSVSEGLVNTFNNPVVVRLRTELANFKCETDGEFMLSKCIGSLFNIVENLTKSLQETQLMAANAEQYSRRDTVTVAGIPLKTPVNDEDIGAIAATELSRSGISVSKEDFTAVHRNSAENKEIQKGQKTITVPPSVTVKFKNINQKDKVLRAYKNYDKANNKPRPVRVYQSLSPYYTNLKKEINTVCNAKKLSISWIHYRSPTCGLAIKMKDSNTVHTKIHCIEHFREKLFLLPENLERPGNAS